MQAMSQHRWAAKALFGAVIGLLSGCGAADDLVCLDSYCASQEGGRYIDHLELDAADFEIEPELQRQNVRSVRAVNKGLFRHDPLQSYAQTVLDRIVAAGPAKQARPQLVIAANASFNAQSLPGGLIVIHHSLFDYLDNEEQLAFILGHEYAHYLLDHFSFFDRLRPYALTAAETVIALQSGGDDTEWRSMLKIYGSDILARDLLYPAWNRRKEDEADRLGVDLMARAGYNPIGAQEFLEVLAAYEDQVGREAKVELNKLEETLEERFGGEEPASPADPATGRIDVVGFLAKKGFNALRQMQAANAARHKEAKERASTVAAYVERDYDDESFLDRPGSNWQTAVSRARPLLANYTAAFEVIKKLESEDVSARDMPSLEAKARAAVSGATQGDSYTRLAFYQLRAQQNKTALAEKNLDIALASDPAPSFQLLQAKAEVLEKKGDTQAAFQLLDEYAESFDWPLSAYLAMIRLAPQVGQKDRRLELVASCAFKYPQSQFACRSAS